MTRPQVTQGVGHELGYQSGWFFWRLVAQPARYRTLRICAPLAPAHRQNTCVILLPSFISPPSRLKLGKSTYCQWLNFVYALAHEHENSEFLDLRFGRAAVELHHIAPFRPAGADPVPSASRPLPLRCHRAGFRDDDP